MPEDLNDRLGSLRGGPEPVLAAPSDVRARGEQRRRRSRALVAGTAALVLLAGAGTALTLARDGTPDALLPVTPTTTASPPAETLNPAAYLLTAQDAASVAGGVWQAEQVVEDPQQPLVVCPTGDGYAGAGARRSLHRDGDQVLSAVVVQADAEEWVAAIRQEVQQCPRRAADSAGGKASNSFTLLSGEGAEDWVLVRDDYRECDSCEPVIRVWLVVGVDDLLSYTRLPDTELPHAGAWLGAVHERLGSAARTPTPSPTAAATDEPTDDALTADDPLRIDRIGPVRVGMTLDEARAAAGQALRQEGDLLGNCIYYAPRSNSPDVSFMVIDGIVSRIDVDESSPTSTEDGIAIGASEADVTRAYPNTEVRPHAYIDGHYLRVLSADRKSAYLFETDGTKVINFRSGFPDAVDQVEGCA